jgi:hypothetical protein
MRRMLIGTAGSEATYETAAIYFTVVHKICPEALRKITKTELTLTFVPPE